MSRCLSDERLQAIADGESTGNDRHAIACPRCAERITARRRMTARLLGAGGTADRPESLRNQMRGRLAGGAERTPRGATTLRPVRHAPGWVWAGGAAAAIAILFVLVVVPGVDRRTTVSAAEIL